MLTFRVIARLDIKNNYVVKGLQFEGLRKLGDPNQFAVKYYNDGIDELLLNDTVASHYGRNSLNDIINKATEHVFVPITVLGGIRTLDDVEKILKSGADKISINTAAIHNPQFITDISKRFGCQCVVSSIEAKKVENDWYCYYENGREISKYPILDWVQIVQEKGAGEILLQSVDRDGLQNGMDEELIEKIVEKVTVPLIITSGVGKLEHLDFISSSVDAVAIGSALHYDILTVQSVKDKLFSLGKIIRNS